MGSCNYDVVVIGAGPGGYKCALKAAKLGLSVACIDENSQCGGTCLRVGCIPSKALLEYSYSYYAAKKHFPKFGVMAKDVTFDLKSMFEVRDKEVSLLSSGIEGLFASAGVRRLHGIAKVEGKEGDYFAVSVGMHDGSVQKVQARNVVLATGSVPAGLPGIDVDGASVIFSDLALNMQVPKRLLVIGAGAIGLEMSSIWSRLGAEVTVVEYADRIAAGFDGEVSKVLLGCLEKQGISFCLSQKVVSVEKKKTGIFAKCESVSGGVTSTIEADVVLVAVGRKPNVKGVVEMAGLLLDDRGFVRVDDMLETSIKGIYAIGDVIGGAMLAHKAEIEGHAVAEILAGGVARVDYGVVPTVIYTHPAASSVGKSEDYLKSVGYGYKVGKSNFAANGRARVSCDTDGFVKVVVCKETDVILGVHIVGASADTMINEAAVALGYRATARDICHVCHSHPDVNEVFRDACEIAHNKR
ncbi:dihydrolipoyl dehydrogenase [Candidatus Anaplasma sp. TIGMIC]|uniref:dihydrolipoyl dehydrogenase n=1 Tax=Candidatus Anaplasma sp. TIGMIC TaxID=3020713 RepID=UPI00232EDD36|nr:dihydrolipoyl dehydrogenase [Candidatus Anaplasma sp. TIGMIC]MDB1134984.1 dihydrolipoyl dehydrogenase [Candidatus Anaplasma sp. TIGMIC]